MTVAHKRPQSFVINGLLATAALYFALDLSAGDRGWVDFTVIGLVGAAICWNVWQLSRRLSALGGRAVWHVQRTVLFWIVGLLNTVYRDPNAPYGWTFAIGVLLVVSAVADTVALYFKERRVLEPGASTGTSPRAQS